MEIALIAAPLEAAGCEGDSVKRALTLYFRAHLLRDSFKDCSINEILADLNDERLLDWCDRESSRPKVYRLYPDDPAQDEETRQKYFEGDYDEARKFLADTFTYIGWKKAQTVLDCIELYHRSVAMEHNIEHQAEIEAREAQDRELATQQGIPIERVRGNFHYLSEIRCDGREDCRNFLRERAVLPELTAAQKMIPLRQRPRRNPLYWDLEEDFLLSLAQWRASKKGSIKKLEAELAAYEKTHFGAKRSSRS